MNTRCKFKCISKTQREDWFSYEFEPVMSGSEENESFFKYTPGGVLKLEVANNHSFEPGKEYYLDLSLAE